MLLLVFSWQIAVFCLVTMPAMLRAANSIFIVFHSRKAGLKPTIYSRQNSQSK
jgi:hypothetical protein